jgi:hypothetical protein
LTLFIIPKAPSNSNGVEKYNIRKGVQKQTIYHPYKKMDRMINLVNLDAADTPYRSAFEIFYGARELWEKFSWFPVMGLTDW